MTIMDSLDFNYNGKFSSEFGIWNVSISSGMSEEVFVANRSIREIQIRGNSKPYFQSVEYEPLTFKLSFAFQDSWDEGKIRDVARWLMQDYYKPLYFSDNPNRIFYCMPVEESQLIHNNLKQGYITITMRCDSPYSYSSVMTSPIYDMSTNVAGGTAIQFINSGDVVCKPEIWITKVGAGDVRIVNNSNKAVEFKFTGLANNEVVYVDNNMEYIETNVPLTYRYSAFNNNYLEMVVGVNNLVVYGNAKINFRYQFKTIQG